MEPSRRRGLVLPGLCLVTDLSLLDEERLVAAVAAAVAGGVTLVQLREKSLPAAKLYRLGRRLLAAIAGRCPLIVNDRVDVALALGAAGVQLGEGSLPVAAARGVAGSDLLIGRSVHSADGARRAQAQGADFLLLGTIFPTRSHPGKPGAGTELVRETRSATTLPIFAIGGINAARAPSVMAAGADGVALISAVLEAPDPGAAAADLATAVREHWRGGRLP